MLVHKSLFANEPNQMTVEMKVFFESRHFGLNQKKTAILRDILRV